MTSLALALGPAEEPAVFSLRHEALVMGLPFIACALLLGAVVYGLFVSR